MSTNTVTTLAQIAARLRRRNHLVNLSFDPSYSAFTAHSAEGELKIDLSESNDEDLLRKLQLIISEENHADGVEPSANARTFVGVLTQAGSPNRYLALAPDGEIALDDYGLPVYFRQHAAAVRNGRKAGAIAVWDRQVDVVEMLP